MVQVSKETMIGDLLRIDQNVAPILLNIGMHCLGCPSSQMETIAEAAMVHGIDADELKSIDLKTGEIKTLAQNVNRYFVDENYLYVLPIKGNYFLRSNRDDVCFERFELTFQPILMVIDGGDIYFTEGGELEAGQRRYQVIRYSNGEETKLPVYSVRMQIVNDKLV